MGADNRARVHASYPNLAEDKMIEEGFVDVTPRIKEVAAHVRQASQDARDHYLQSDSEGEVWRTANILGLLAEAYQWAGHIRRICKLLGIEDEAIDMITKDAYISGSESARVYQYTTNDTGEA